MKALFATTALILTTSSMAFAQPDGTPPGLENHGGVAPSSTKADPQGPDSIDTAPTFSPAGRKG